MTPDQVAVGLFDTFDRAVYVVGFLAIVGIAGGFVDLRLAKKWRMLKQARWSKLYR